VGRGRGACGTPFGDAGSGATPVRPGSHPYASGSRRQTARRHYDRLWVLPTLRAVTVRENGAVPESGRRWLKIAAAGARLSAQLGLPDWRSTSARHPFAFKRRG